MVDEFIASGIDTEHTHIIIVSASMVLHDVWYGSWHRHSFRAPSTVKPESDLTAFIDFDCACTSGEMSLFSASVQGVWVFEHQEMCQPGWAIERRRDVGKG